MIETAFLRMLRIGLYWQAHGVAICFVFGATIVVLGVSKGSTYPLTASVPLEGTLDSDSDDERSEQGVARRRPAVYLFGRANRVFDRQRDGDKVVDGNITGPPSRHIHLTIPARYFGGAETAKAFVAKAVELANVADGEVTLRIEDALCWDHRRKISGNDVDSSWIVAADVRFGPAATVLDEDAAQKMSKTIAFLARFEDYRDGALAEGLAVASTSRPLSPLYLVDRSAQSPPDARPIIAKDESVSGRIVDWAPELGGAGWRFELPFATTWDGVGPAFLVGPENGNIAVGLSECRLVPKVTRFETIELAWTARLSLVKTRD
jgi:hypothetical protein